LSERVWTEEFKVDGETLNATIRDIIREGKARRIIVKNARGRTVLKVPLWLGAAAVLNNPRILLLGTMVSARKPLTIIVEKVEEDPSPQPG
jgi:hypothetical protein